MSKKKMVRLCELASMNRGNMGSHVGKLATDKNSFWLLRTLLGFSVSEFYVGSINLSCFFTLSDKNCMRIALSLASHFPSSLSQGGADIIAARLLYPDF